MSNELEKSSLNRRKKAKFEGQFKGLVKATQKGMKAGKKAKLVEKMKKMKDFRRLERKEILLNDKINFYQNEATNFFVK